MSKKVNKTLKALSKFSLLRLFSALKLLTLSLYNNYTYVALYIHHYIKTVHFWLKYNGLRPWYCAKTTQLIEGGNRGLHDMPMLLLLRFLTFFTCFGHVETRAMRPTFSRCWCLDQLGTCTRNSDGARCLKVGVHEKPYLAEALHERHTREFDGESWGPPPEKNWIWDCRRYTFPLSCGAYLHASVSY